MTEERLAKIAHDTSYRVAKIYQICTEAMRKVDIELSKILLNKEELDDQDTEKKTD